MAKRRKTRLRKIREAWNALPEIDRRFVSTLVVLQHTIGEEKLTYRETPRPLQRLLLTFDRNTVLSVIIQCLYLLLDASVLKRAKKARRQRAAKKKKRVPAAKKKKRVSSPKKKRSTKKPAPKRRTTRKGPSR